MESSAGFETGTGIAVDSGESTSGSDPITATGNAGFDEGFLAGTCSGAESSQSGAGSITGGQPQRVLKAGAATKSFDNGGRGPSTGPTARGQTKKQ